MKREDIEIMAPAGSYESLTAAIQGGADSVYFGIENLNMRAASSNNFTLKDLRKIVTLCRKKGMKSYLTLNVVVYDEEIKQMQKIVDAAAGCGVTAIIASDQSVINYAFSKGVEVHLSTQLNISNIESVKFYSQWADVAVLARELNLDQVKNIAAEIKKKKIKGPKGELVRLEIFAHGALCMAISGKCYLSLHEYGKSANRGECYQICRRKYVVTDSETDYEIGIDNQYIMSPKDLCTIGFLDKIIDAGVKVIKIEGRARSAEYVRIVTSCYDEAVKAIAEGSYTAGKIDNWTARLATVFNRGFWDGYYLGREMGEWTGRYGSSATKRKLYIGKVTNYFTKKKVAEIKLENGDLEPGETILITGPSTGVIEYVVKEIRGEDFNVTEKALKGSACSFLIDDYLRRSDKVFKWVDSGR
jgi:U32 family peptidase